VGVSGRTLIKLIMEHGFKPPEDPNKPAEAEGAATGDESESAVKADAGKTD
jgi:hypothetical protein